ncbi:MAG: endo-1,4-beta-xylanase [Thermoguttaceae bacterium]|nr:endo-1,4-beta-xylanase [Thermoguttaceae bacterium]
MSKFLTIVSVILVMVTAIAVSTFGAEEKKDVMSPEYRALWNEQVQKEIDARIEVYRKGKGTIALTTVKPGSEVVVKQVKHKFLFGAHIFNFNQLGSDELNQKYKDLYGTLFNSATVAFYWQTFEPTQGKPRFKAAYEDTAEFWNKQKDPKNQPHWRRPASDPVVEFCLSKGIQMNGHTMIWGSPKWQVPNWLDQSPEKVADMERLFEKRIRELAEHYGNRLNRWDVVNESATDYILHSQGKFVFGKPYKNKAGKVCMNSLYGVMPADYTFKSFKIANDAFPPSVEMNINEYNVCDDYAKQIDDLTNRGCRITNVGVQMHLFNPKDCLAIAAGKPIQSPEVQKTRLMAADRVGKPLHLSEITITSPGNDERGMAIQAEIARNLYRFWFSWPSMKGITWWNVVDDCGAPGEPSVSGLFTRDMKPKPSFFALNKLINEEWKTNFTVKATESNFTHEFRGFRGDYEITWTDVNGKKNTSSLRIY